MGLSKPALAFLIREHQRQPFCGPLVTLGRQAVYATPLEVNRLCHAAGVATRLTDEDRNARTNIPQWQGTRQARNTSDVAFFRCLGLDEVVALDCSEYEGADIVADLNDPLDAALENRFACVLDGGTCEHVFNVRQCLTNVARLVRPGGRVIHLSPMNNYANHGFYQLSPTLFFDYYSANRFENPRGFVVEQSISLRGRNRWSLFEWNAARGEHHLTSRNQLLFIFVAEKTASSTVDKVPLQSSYRKQFAASQGVASETAGKLHGIWHRLPLWAQVSLRRYVPRLDPARRPWRLKRTAQLV